MYGVARGCRGTSQSCRSAARWHIRTSNNHSCDDASVTGDTRNGWALQNFPRLEPRSITVNILQTAPDLAPAPAAMSTELPLLNRLNNQRWGNVKWKFLLAFRRVLTDAASRGWLPGASRLLDGFRNGQDQLVFKRPANHLHTDGQSFVRNGEGNRCAGKAGQVQPLRKPHGVTVARAGEIISLTMKKRGTRGNRREQDRRVVHLAQNLGAEKIPIRAGVREFIECNRISRGRAGEILAQNWAGFILMAREAVLEQIADHWAKEKPPKIECAIESIQTEGFDVETSLDE